jgi:hypothetical protein
MLPRPRQKRLAAKEILREVDLALWRAWQGRDPGVDTRNSAPPPFPPEAADRQNYDPQNYFAICEGAHRFGGEQLLTLS